MPKASGSVELVLMSSSKDENGFAVFRKMNVKGATLLNGDFSKIAENGKPENWQINDAAKILKESNANCAKVNHNNRLSQRISIEVGKPVEISFETKSEN